MQAHILCSCTETSLPVGRHAELFQVIQPSESPWASTIVQVVMVTMHVDGIGVKKEILYQAGKVNLHADAL